jgi:hypothetical protein
MNFELRFNWFFLDPTQDWDWASTLSNHIHKCYKISTLGWITEEVPVISHIWRTDVLLSQSSMKMILCSRASCAMRSPLDTLVYTSRFSEELYSLTTIWNQLQVLSLRRTQLLWDEKTKSFFFNLQNLRELSLDDIGDGTWPWTRSLLGIPEPPI